MNLTSTFDGNKFYLGAMCRRRHDYKDSGETLRRLRGGGCVECMKMYSAKHHQEYYPKNKKRMRVNHAAYRATHKDAITEGNKRYFQKHKVRLQAQNRTYAQTHKDKINAANRRRYHERPEVYIPILRRSKEKHRDAANARNREYRQENKEAIRFYQRTSLKHKQSRKLYKQRRRAKLLTATVETVTCKQLDLIWREFNESCAYCFVLLSFAEVNWDHVISIAKGGPHAVWNLVPTCRPCNTRKNKLDLSDWYKRQPFFSANQLEKVLARLRDREY